MARLAVLDRRMGMNDGDGYVSSVCSVTYLSSSTATVVIIIIVVIVAYNLSLVFDRLGG